MEQKYPGVYVQDLPGGAAIQGVSTSLTAFLGRAPMGPAMTPVTCSSLGEVQGAFGNDWAGLPMGQSLSDYFQNGGGEALVVRLVGEGAAPSALAFGELSLVAADPGSWGDGLTVSVTELEPDGSFTLAVSLSLNGQTFSETFAGLSVDVEAGPRRIDHVLAVSSRFLRVAVDTAGQPRLPPSPPALGATAAGSGGADGSPLSAQDLIDGLAALEQVPMFNLLVIPPDQLGQDIAPAVWQAAASCCQDRRAFLIVDPPSAWTSAETAASEISANPLMAPDLGRNAAVYFPNLIHDGPFPPSGAVAGVYAATDRTRGVWAAPAGASATLDGIEGLALNLTDSDNGLINTLGVNALRVFPALGTVVWGARTLAGADTLADDYKYVSVRRLRLYIEQSFYQSSRWAVFEPNTETLWASLRQAMSLFLQTLQNQRAFYSFQVACDASTTSQLDIDRGVVNLIVMIAPVQPAEFVVIPFQLLVQAGGS